MTTCHVINTYFISPHHHSFALSGKQFNSTRSKEPTFLYKKVYYELLSKAVKIFHKTEERSHLRQQNHISPVTDILQESKMNIHSLTFLRAVVEKMNMCTSTKTLRFLSDISINEHLESICTLM